MKCLFKIITILMLFMSCMYAHLYTINSKNSATAELTSSHPVYGDFFISIPRFRGYVNIGDDKKITDFKMDIQLKNITSTKKSGEDANYEKFKEDASADTKRLFKGLGKNIKLRFKNYYSTGGRRGVATVSTKIGKKSKDIKYYVTFVESAKLGKEDVIMEGKIINRDFQLAKNIRKYRLKIGNSLKLTIRFTEER